MRILLADDHVLFREAIARYFEYMLPDTEVHPANDIQDVMGLLAEQAAFDMVLLDLCMPGMKDLEGLRKLRQVWPYAPVVLLSGRAEPRDVEQAMALGARGYLPKTLTGDALLAGIGEIMAGRDFVARDHASGGIMPAHYEESAPAGAQDVAFTPREKQVLDYLLHGESNKAIARALELKTVTVKLHLRGICRKLGAKNRTQAALFAREKGF
jgi:two-component system, NarL family, nitrate/nitrite response regulator NarL